MEIRKLRLNGDGDGEIYLNFTHFDSKLYYRLRRTFNFCKALHTPQF